MKMMFHFLEPMKDPFGFELPVCPRAGESVAFESVTYRVKEVIHSPTYDDEFLRIRVILEEAESA
jgi:hypothetical protein